MKSLRFFFACLAIGIWVTSMASAQEGDPGQRLLEERKREAELEALASATAGQDVNTPERAGVVKESVCFPIEVIQLEGVSVYKLKVFTPILSEFSGKCLGQASIGNLLQRISNRYADDGYITTRAYVPAQDIAGRTLTVQVLEGKVESFIYQQIDDKGKPRPGPVRKLKSAMPIQAGDVFQLRDLEHGLEQMNRLRSSQANANLSAGVEPGASLIVVQEQKADTVRGTFGLNSRGDKTTGKTQVSIGVEADDLLGLNDTYYLSYSGSRNSNALALSFSIPYRKWLFSANRSYSESLSPVSQNSDLISQTANLTFSAERLISRNARSKYILRGSVNFYWNERYINIAELQPQHRTALTFGLRQEHRTKNAVISADTSLSFGAPFLGGDDAPAIGRGAPRSKYVKLHNRFNYIRPFKNGRQLTTTVVGQLSNRPLFSNEQFSIGGWETVRGYAGHSFSGDSGIFIRTELSFPASAWDFRKYGKGLDKTILPNPLKNARGGFRPFLFADFGFASSRASDRLSRLLSTGFGFSSQLGNSTLNGALAIPLLSANGQSSGSIQGYLGLSVKIF